MNRHTCIDDRRLTMIRQPIEGPVVRNGRTFLFVWPQNGNSLAAAEESARDTVTNGHISSGFPQNQMIIIELAENRFMFSFARVTMYARWFSYFKRLTPYVKPVTKSAIKEEGKEDD